MKELSQWQKAELLLEKKLDYIGQKPWLFVILIMIFNLITKGFNLNDASLWLDEASQINLSIKSIKEIIKESLIYPNAPFYTLLLNIWIKLFDIGEFATRSLSVLFSVATVPVIFFMARRHFNIYTAVFSTIIFSVSYLHLYYAHEVRSYTLVSLLATISFWLFLDILENPGWKKTLFLIIINSLLLYTHLTAILIFPVQGLVLIFYLRNYKKILQIGLSFAIPLFFLSFWFLNNEWFRGGETVWLSIPKPKDIVNMYSAFFNKGAAVLAVIIIILSVFYYFYPKNKPKKISRKKVLLLLLWTFIPVIILYISSIYYNPRFINRYVLFASFGAYILVPYIASNYKISTLIAVLIISLYFLGSLLNMNLNPHKGEDWKNAVDYYLEEVKTPATLTIVSAWYQWLPFSYYYSHDYFKEYSNTLELLKNENIYFTNRTEVLNSVDLEEFDHIVLVLSHYNFADPKQLLLQRIEAKYDQTDQSRSFTGVNVIVYTKTPYN